MELQFLEKNVKLYIHFFFFYKQSNIIQSDILYIEETRIFSFCSMVIKDMPITQDVIKSLAP